MDVPVVPADSDTPSRGAARSGHAAPVGGPQHAHPSPADRLPLGVTLHQGGALFAVFAEAESLRLRLVHPGTRETFVHDMKPVAGEPGVWASEVPGEWRGWTYEYELTRDGRTLSEVIDPRARLVRHGRAYIVEERTPVKPRPALDPADAIIYELHLRDFTRDPACGVASDYRGRYLGLAQRGTTLRPLERRAKAPAPGSGPSDGAAPPGSARPIVTGLDHICELGVTVVQLMPVHAFALPYHPEYEWGYMPTDYQAPHPGYASSVEVAAPIREFKALVSALHAAGLRVTLDMVFNHTAERWPSRLHSFMALAPRAYFRFKEDGTPWDGALCGNEFRSESPQGRRFIVETCRLWVQEYGVDGFRFDLMGLIDRGTMDEVARELHAIDPTILIYGEPWAAGPTPVDGEKKGTQRGRGISVFSDEFRDAFRGNVFDLANAGFLACGQNIEWVKKGVLGGVTSFADSPLESVNYLECHDNHTLLDRLEAGSRHFSFGPQGALGLSDDDKRKMSALGALALMTSQGTPFLHSGQEFGRSKEGHENSYNLGDQVNNIRWHDKAEQAPLYAFYRDAVALRRAHPMFRLRTKADVLRAVEFLDEQPRLNVPRGCVAFRVTDITGRDAWREAVVLMNGTAETAWLPLPEGEWRVHPLGEGPQIGDTEGGAREWVEVPGHSGGVVYRRR